LEKNFRKPQGGIFFDSHRICIPVDETNIELSHFYNFRTSVTLTLDQAIRHTAVYHSSTSTKFHPNQKTVSRPLSSNRYVDDSNMPVHG